MKILMPMLLLLCASETLADSLATGDGKLIGTGAVASIDGSAGGGIVPMAILAGYATAGQHGGTVSANRLDSADFALRGFSAAWSLDNRVELSVARQELDISAFAPLDGETLRSNSYGIKVRLAGDILYTSLPQIAVGVVYREAINPALAALGGVSVPTALGARDDGGTDVYVAFTKVFLGGPFGRNWLLNTVARSTRANQGGLLGFGGDLDKGRSLVGEASLGVLLSRHWLIGAEYRQHPDNLSAFSQDDWMDAFVVWFPNKRWSVTAAWVNLGELSTPAIPYHRDHRDQHGAFVSLTGAF